MKKLLSLLLCGLMLLTGSALAEPIAIDTKDLDGNPVTNEAIAEAKVVLLNFWEPWCGPCVNEMPYLEKLYENYKDQGLLIVGVYSTLSMEEDARAVLQDVGTTYPIWQWADCFTSYATDYVLTSVFLSGDGEMLCEEPLVGARSYKDWETLVKSYLEAAK